MIYWSELPEEIVFAENFAVSHETLIFQLVAAVGALEAFGVPILIQHFEDESVEDE